MLALGLAVAFPSAGRPVVRAVLLDSPHSAGTPIDRAAIVVRDEFDLTTATHDWAEICAQFHRDVSARVSTLMPERVVVRLADFHRSRGQASGPRLRLAIEGSVTAAAMHHVVRTAMLSGVDCANRYGTTKDVLDSHAGSLGAGSNRTEAAAAALAALS